MSSFHAAYLIHGDDHGRIAERRASLRAKAEAESGSAGVEVFEGDASTPEAVANALSTMTFALGRRFVIADGVERWKEAGVEQVAQALAGADPETLTVAFFAREEGRHKVSPKLVKAVERAGGKVAEEKSVYEKALPRWVTAQARTKDIELDDAGAKVLIAHVGTRQQRLVRELEKLALEYGEGAAVSAEEVEASCATSAERKVWDLADALVAGDQRVAIRRLLELREQGERTTGLIWNMARRLREAIAVSNALAAGQPAAEIKRSLRMPRDAADRFLKDVQARDVESLRRALAAIADLEVESRGGSGGVLSEDTAAVRAVLAAAF